MKGRVREEKRERLIKREKKERKALKEGKKNTVWFQGHRNIVMVFRPLKIVLFGMVKRVKRSPLEHGFCV